MDNLQSLFFYIVTILITLYLYYLSNKKKSKSLLLICLIFISIIFGFRHNVGTDYWNYIYNIKYSVFSYTEPISSLISYAGNITGNAQISLALFVFLTILFITKAIEKYFSNSNSRLIAFTMYLFMFFPHSLNTVRECLSVALVLYSFTFIIDGEKTYKGFLWFLCSVLVHNGSLIFSPVFIFLKVKKSSNIYLILSYLSVVFFIIILCVYRIKLPILSRFNYYIDNLEFDIGIGIIFKNIPLMLYFSVLSKYYKYNYLHKKIDYMIGISICGIALRHLAYINYSFYRFSNYFDIFNIILIGFLPTLFNKKNHFILSTLLILFLISYFIFNFYISGTGGIFPYDFKLSY